jgi:hypothetical protein
MLNQEALAPYLRLQNGGSMTVIALIATASRGLIPTLANGLKLEPHLSWRSRMTLKDTCMRFVVCSTTPAR